VHLLAEALVAALETQVTTGRQVRAPQLPLPSACPGWSVREVLNHSIGVTLKFTGFAAGVTDHPRAPAGDLVGRDHALALRSAAGSARAAWASADMTRRCHLPFRHVPGRPGRRDQPVRRPRPHLGYRHRHGGNRAVQ
jgi:hypothetical protein